MKSAVNSNRREFGKAVLAGAAGGGALNARGNKWSATGLRLGVSHQRPQMLTDDHLKYLKQMGVEYLEVRAPSAQSSLPASAAENLARPASAATINASPSARTT